MAKANSSPRPLAPTPSPSTDEAGGHDDVWVFHDALSAVLRTMVAAGWDGTGSDTVTIGNYTGKLEFFVCKSEFAHYHDW